MSDESKVGKLLRLFSRIEPSAGQAIGLLDDPLLNPLILLARILKSDTKSKVAMIAFDVGTRQEILNFDVDADSYFLLKLLEIELYNFQSFAPVIQVYVNDKPLFTDGYTTLAPYPRVRSIPCHQVIEPGANVRVFLTVTHVGGVANSIPDLFKIADRVYFLATDKHLLIDDVTDGNVPNPAPVDRVTGAPGNISSWLSASFQFVEAAVVHLYGAADYDFYVEITAVGGANYTIKTQLYYEDLRDANNQNILVDLPFFAPLAVAVPKTVGIPQDNLRARLKYSVTAHSGGTRPNITSIKLKQTRAQKSPSWGNSTAVGVAAHGLKIPRELFKKIGSGK